jgi:thiamine pyrophosphokinase
MSETVEGICLEGLEYPLENATLRQGSTRGISNVFVKPVARITIRSGLLLVIKACD